MSDHMRMESISRITGAALSVFAEFGFQGTTMKQIAAASGMSYGLVYHYFPAKEEIFRHLVDYALDSSLYGMQQVMQIPDSAWNRIKLYSEILIQNALSGESALYFLIILQAMTQGKGIPGFMEHISKKTSQYFEILSPVIAEAQREGEAVEGDPLVLATAYLSFVQGLSLFVLHGKGLEKNINPEMLYSVLQKKK